MKRVIVLSRRLRYGFLATLVGLVVLSGGLMWMLPEGGEVEARHSSTSQGAGQVVELDAGVRAALTTPWDARDETGPVPVAERILATLLMLCVVAAWGAVLYQFERLLALYQRGRVFERESAGRIRKAGLLLALAPVVELAVMLLEGPLRFALGLAKSLRFEAEVDHLTLFFIFVGLAAAIIGRVMEEAAARDDDAELTV